MQITPWLNPERNCRWRTRLWDHGSGKRRKPAPVRALGAELNKQFATDEWRAEVLSHMHLIRYASTWQTFGADLFSLPFPALLHPICSPPCLHGWGTSNLERRAKEQDEYCRLWLVWFLVSLISKVGSYISSWASYIWTTTRAKKRCLDFTCPGMHRCSKLVSSLISCISYLFSSHTHSLLMPTVPGVVSPAN